MPTIEFLGLPGAGKSTLAAQLSGALGAESLATAVRRTIARSGADSLSRVAARVGGLFWRASYPRSTDRFRALAEFLADYPEVLEVAGAAMASKRNRGMQRDSDADFFLNFLARYRLAVTMNPRGIVVIDEGFAQKAITLFANGFQGEDELLLARYLRVVPPPTVLVHVVTSSELCVERIQNRHWSKGVLAAGPYSRQLFLDGASAVAERVVASHFHETSLITIHGTGDPCVVSDRLAGVIAPMLRDG